MPDFPWRFSAASRRSLPVLCVNCSALFLILESFSLACMLTFQHLCAGTYLPLTAVLGGRLFVRPMGYLEAARDVIRLSPHIPEMLAQVTRRLASSSSLTASFTPFELSVGRGSPAWRLRVPGNTLYCFGSSRAGWTNSRSGM